MQQDQLQVSLPTPISHEMCAGSHEPADTNAVFAPVQATGAPDYHQLYASLLHQHGSQPQPVLSHADAASLYQEGLHAAADTALASISQQNRQRRGQLRDELHNHLATLPYGKHLGNCTPEDLLVYMQMVYIPRHAGSILPNGTCIAAPSTIANVVSHLRMLFKELGRGEQWLDDSRTGNPAAAHQIKQWCQGHEKVSVSHGFRGSSAVPMQITTIQQLLHHLFQTIADPAQTAYSKALAARDGFSFCLLWQTGMRSVNGRTVQFSDFTLPDQARGSLQAYLQSPALQPHPALIQVQPQRTKTQLQNPFRISIPPAEEPILDVYFWLVGLTATAHLAGQPITAQLVRTSQPLQGAAASSQAHMLGPQFSERELSRAGLHARLITRLQAAGVYNGESLHSFRRGMAQYKVATGQTHEQVMSQMLLKTKRILETVYLPCSRHLSGVKRLRSTPGLARPSKL